MTNYVIALLIYDVTMMQPYYIEVNLNAPTFPTGALSYVALNTLSSPKVYHGKLLSNSLRYYVGSSSLITLSPTYS